MVPRSPATLPKLGRCGRSMVGHCLASHLVHPDFWWHMVTLFSGKTSHLVWPIWPMRWSRAHSEQTYWENMRNHDEKNSWSAPGPRIDHTAHTNTKRIGINHINPLCLCQEHTRISNLCWLNYGLFIQDAPEVRNLPRPAMSIGTWARCPSTVLSGM